MDGCERVGDVAGDSAAKREGGRVSEREEGRQKAGKAHAAAAGQRGERERRERDGEEGVGAACSVVSRESAPLICDRKGSG